MRIFVFGFIYVLYWITQNCLGLKYVDVPQQAIDEETAMNYVNVTQVETGYTIANEEFLSETPPTDSDSEHYAAKIEDQISRRLYQLDDLPRLRAQGDPTTIKIKDKRRAWRMTPALDESTVDVNAKIDKDDKDASMKQKINALIQQTTNDVENKLSGFVEDTKDRFREEPPYKVGFILSLLKKTSNVLNELFNVAMKNKSQWRALEHMKTFELISHTNVDATHLIRHMVEIHIQNLNQTQNEKTNNGDGKRIKRMKKMLMV